MYQELFYLAQDPILIWAQIFVCEFLGDTNQAEHISFAPNRYMIQKAEDNKNDFIASVDPGWSLILLWLHPPNHLAIKVLA